MHFPIKNGLKLLERCTADLTSIQRNLLTFVYFGVNRDFLNAPSTAVRRHGYSSPIKCVLFIFGGAI